MSHELEGYYVKKMGQNRGAPRIWLEGTQTEKAGFKPGQKYDIAIQGKTLVLTACEDGTRVVSSKKSGDKINPVIDLNSRELLAMFDGMSAIRVAVKKGEIYLVPLATELKKQERTQRLRRKLETGDALTIGSLSHGGGILTNAIHHGLQNAGIKTELAFANDIRGELLEHAAVHNDAWNENTKVYAAPMQELAFDERGLCSIPKTEIMEFGVPCESSSSSGMAKNGNKIAEAHEHTGHLVVAGLIILAKVNPAIVIYECVPNYFSTASAAILRTQLKDLGYVTHEAVLNGKQWGELENRNRWVMVAVSEGIQFDLSQLMPPTHAPRKLGEILEQIPDDDPRWSRMDYLKDKAVRDADAGKGFKCKSLPQTPNMSAR
ncbi:DNA cytosine methyltransferase [Undibacterium arcticum]|uniref:DNA cytosine methyltransferase n=1 Tax=Undibacterium arcticum TaxID=1762892 RepID=UPI003622D13E